MRERGFTLESRRRIEQLGGLEAFVGVYRGNAKGVGKVSVRAAHVTIGRQVYVVAGFAPKDEFPRVEAEFTQAVRRSGSSEQRGGGRAPEPSRLLHRPPAGDSWQSIAQRAGKGSCRRPLAIMNGSRSTCSRRRATA